MASLAITGADAKDAPPPEPSVVDPEQTPEERLQYLRDRGVEVDLHEDRAKPKVTAVTS
jgi:hypothetical protein